MKRTETYIAPNGAEITIVWTPTSPEVVTIDGEVASLVFRRGEVEDRHISACLCDACLPGTPCL